MFASINKRKTTAILMGLTLSLSGSVFASPAQATDLDSRIAALEQEQQKLADELATLKHQNSQLKNQVKSQKSQLKGLNKNLNAHKDRIQFTGFGRLSWDNDNLKGYNDRNDGKRAYLDLKAKFHVNDKWNFNFESETNERYAKKVSSDGATSYHFGRDDEDGTIQRVWAEGKIGAVEVDAGRRWRGLGFQNVLFGNESDGVVLKTDIPKSKIKASTFYLTPTDKGYHFSIYGAGVQGFVGHGLQINCAFAKTNVGKHESLGQDYWNPNKQITFSGINGQIYYMGMKGGDFTNWLNGVGATTDTASISDGKSITYVKDVKMVGQGAFHNDYSDIKGVTLDGSAVNINGKVSSVTTTYPELPNTVGTEGFVLSAMWNPLKNIFFIGDYVRTNADNYDDVALGASGHDDSSRHYSNKASKAIRLNYRWSNIDNPGSFQLYARWYDYCMNANNLVGLFGDKEWSAFQPGSKGWAVGFKYVPMKNMEWETFYVGSTAHDTKYGCWQNQYHRNFLRTMVDYHF